MLARIQKWGNSQGIRFPKTILEEANISVGDEIAISVHEGKIIVEPMRKIRGKYRIQELVARMPEDYEVEEVNWGAPLGKEVW
jgi:antitoxin MazE